tara:strand:- start:116 stop:493 length:378 start_codon:yes stop_codon:yes gene_type:complete
MTSYQNKQQEIKDFCLDRLREIAEYMDNQDYRDAEVWDLHNDIFNTDYYIVGRYQAKEWMGAEAFDMIGDIVEYEKDNYGELHCDLSEPERVVNMWVYIQGWKCIHECYETVRDELTDQCELDVG